VTLPPQPEGEWMFVVLAVDNAENESNLSNHYFKIDTQPPAQLNPDDHVDGWTANSTSVSRSRTIPVVSVLQDGGSTAEAKANILSPLAIHQAT